MKQKVKIITQWNCCLPYVFYIKLDYLKKGNKRIGHAFN